MNNINSIRKYAIPPLITFLLFGIILAVKGIYPFGSNTIDYYDMAQQFAPFYYHLYDAIHGTKGLFFDWYTALGTNMSSVSNCSNLSPFNLFFLFIRREALLQSLSVFTGIKLMFMSFSMYFYVTRTCKKTSESFRVIAAVSYAFSGFVLLNYTINPWLDIAAMFPLLMHFYDRTITQGKITGYVILLALTFVTSYYHGAMILIFLFLYTGIIIVRDKLFGDKVTVNCRVLELGIGTVIGSALSAFIVVPQLMQALGSARFKNGTGSEGLFATYLEILSHVKGEYATRWWTLLGVSFAVAVILTGIVRFRKDRRLMFTTFFMPALVLAELFIESTNLMMHFGSYVHYPIRNGYIICFVFGYLMCEHAGRLYAEESAERKSFVAFLGIPVAAIGFTPFVLWLNNNKGLPFRNVFHVTAAIMAGTLAIYLIILNLPYIKRFKVSGSIRQLSWGIIACEILCYGFLLFGQPDFVLGYAEAPEQSNDYIYTCNRLQDAFDLEPERLHRIKNPDESLNANYGFVLMQPALSSWTAMLPPGEQMGAAKWGYSFQYTRLLDSGGTVFSDALLGIDKVVSCVPVDERLYEPIDEADGYTLYRPRYTLPFGAMIKDDDKQWVSSDAVELHNTAYHAIESAAGKKTDEDIATWLVKGSEDERITIDVTDPTALYLLGAGGDRDERSLTFEIIRDGEEPQIIRVPDIGDPGNTGYPAYFNNNALCLGSFENETVTIQVINDAEKGVEFPIDVMSLDLGMLESICKDCEDMAASEIQAGKTSLTLTVDNSNDSADAILLPLAYDKGWTATVNGQPVSIREQAGLFTQIPLSEGNNTIEIRFVPKGMTQGICVSIAALALLVLYGILDRKAAIKLDGTDAVLRKLYIAVFAAAFLMIYAIPAVYTLVALVGGKF